MVIAGVSLLTYAGMILFFVCLLLMTVRKFHSPRYLRAMASLAVFVLLVTLFGALTAWPWYQICVAAGVAVMVEYLLNVMLDKLTATS